MKKNLIIGALSVLLIIALFVIVRQERPAQEPPVEPAPQADQTEPSKPVQLSEPEKTEISQEELEVIFENVYTTASGSHPEDWSIDFQITDEIGKINKAIPEDKKAPENLREIYTEWRTARVDTASKTSGGASESNDTESTPVADYGFTAVDETLYATSQVNLRSGPGTNYDKQGSLSTGAAVHRIGIGTGTAEGWSQIELSDGTRLCVSSKYLSYNKPVTQQSPSNTGSQSSSTTEQSGGQSQTQQPSSTPSDSGSNEIWGDFDPMAGLTEEEIQQKIEDSYNTKYKVNGT